MALERRQAVKKKAKLRLGIAGPSGAGKSYSSLLMGYGITKDWSKITLIDTENNSGDLYADLADGDVTYNVIPLEKPYTPARYIEAIKMCIDAGDEVVIIDSMSHAWSGEGGMLDQQGKIADRSGNSYTAWRTISPQHNQLIDTILSSPIHVICTVRSKTEYVQEKDGNGKTVVRKVGMGTVFKDGLEFEMTTFMELNQDHSCQATKDRTNLFDINYWFTPTKETGEQLLGWLNSGKDPEPIEKPKVAEEKPKQPKPTPPTNQSERDAKMSEIIDLMSKLGWDGNKLKQECVKLVGKENSSEYTIEEFNTIIDYMKKQQG